MDRDGLGLMIVLGAVAVILAAIGYLFLPYLGSALSITSAMQVGA